jgi:hypothetical protein
MMAYQEAIQLFEEEDPDMDMYGVYVADLHYKLGQVLSSLPDDICANGSCTEHAVEQLRKSLRLVPDNPMAEHALAALMEVRVDGASPEYVAALFDDYAETFDSSLESLEYRAPELLAQMLTQLSTSFGTIFDAGCGTGLMGVLLHDMTDTLIGVDLSSKMIDKARERQIYDELVVGDIVQEVGFVFLLLLLLLLLLLQLLRSLSLCEAPGGKSFHPHLPHILPLPPSALIFSISPDESSICGGS